MDDQHVVCAGTMSWTAGGTKTAVAKPATRSAPSSTPDHFAVCVLCPYNFRFFAGFGAPPHCQRELACPSGHN
eukprot:jgi/Chrzof1/6390/Cz18g08160.t1